MEYCVGINKAINCWRNLAWLRFEPGSPKWHTGALSTTPRTHARGLFFLNCGLGRNIEPLQKMPIGMKFSHRVESPSKKTNPADFADKFVRIGNKARLLESNYKSPLQQSFTTCSTTEFFILRSTFESLVEKNVDILSWCAFVQIALNEKWQLQRVLWPSVANSLVGFCKRTY
jgi:hypothetical protein